MGLLMWILYLIGSFLAAVGLSNCKEYKKNMTYLGTDSIYIACTVALVIGSWVTVGVLIYYKLKKKW